MAGLYFHIPFCRQACHYCNFHFSTSFKKKDELMQAMRTELAMHRDDWTGHEFGTIYFGGGTPSAVAPADIDALIRQILSLYEVAPDPEITLEANPEDVTAENLTAWKASGINRLSIGIQGLQDGMLRNWNRIHDAAGALASIERAQTAGFSNISIDLIYGGPELEDAEWIRNLETVIGLGVPHVSCYALTVEERTAMAYQVRQGRRPPVDEARAARHYVILQETMRDHGYQQYEVSNFSLPGWHSRHNTSYWQDVPYLGIGPAAHSYDGTKRLWNIAHNIRYIDAIEAGALLTEFEILSPAERFNELVMTGLRTSFGIDLGQVNSMGARFTDHLLAQARRYVASGQIVATDERLFITPGSYFLSDGIAADLFMVKD